MEEYWGQILTGDSQEPEHFHVGDLHLWIRRTENEVWMGHRHQIPDADKTGIVDGEKPPEDLEWKRWALKDIKGELRLKPVFPDLPIVVNSDYQLKVTPANTIQIFSRIPVWVSVVHGKKEIVLTELPTVRLSRTWFGSPMEGELCYWATTKARRSLAHVENKSYLVSCPIQITNKSEEDLSFVKFCFRVERLKIFLVGEELWADETRIVYQGEEQQSDITMSGRLIKGLEKGKLVSEPRKPIQKSLATRTFRMIFDDSFIFGR